ncbi:NAD-dependent epimerase/dehydratase family protein [Paucidesulfovibrio longus]|uniref:NAD-dependent epimerase/dehydratase family protein n=1 Tax=Paucidesulfovibrio longus TaxID=889 RepID=UPI0003B4AF2E|nr:NAD-dependent epimerase/dehydratase family protein [Paucidesulfovibrio longus]
MSVCIVTGSGGLIGAQSARFFAEKGLDVVGIDNDMRRYFFGEQASTKWQVRQLAENLPRYEHHAADIRDADAVDKVFAAYGKDVRIIIHAAAQPSHDWAAREPFTDFDINARGTLVMLEAARKHCPEAVFVFTSTNKVYGDTPNRLPLVELETRWELDPAHPWHARGIDESMSIDASTHSVFGASKVAADIMVQEYGRYFGMNTVVFRGGCLTGSGHSGAELHGFLAYLVKCGLTGAPYTVFGYKGKQVRDNIHSSDLVNMFWEFMQAPRPGEVYNAGGGRHSNCSMLEAIALCEEISGRPFRWSYAEDNRVGDHVWWISDVSKFKAHYPHWEYTMNVRDIVEEIAENLGHRLR